MRAIVLWEPYASAMALGRKRNETRHWETSYRGDLVICAAKRKMTLEASLLMGNAVKPPEGYQVPYGCAVCIVEVYDIVPTALYRGPDSPPLTVFESNLGDYQVGRYAWLTRNLRRLKSPVPVVGRQGLWNLSPEEEARVRQELPA